MKALPLWQPWASLVACEKKKVETRHWTPPPWLVGERIAIYATKRKVDPDVALPEFAAALGEAEAEGTLQLIDGGLPLGMLLCTVRIDRVREITTELAGEMWRMNAREYAFGNYQAGRYGWVLKDVQRIVPVPTHPTTFRATQGIFEVPDVLLTPAPDLIPAQGRLSL